ncbi:unnamed protein product [Miscanthus lutarioriparius]|uniref:Disease resistance protein At4g27190-like leucine-rich repeats domain-containing protein n=1 Tax=Miscanthus lutarioriparius TaxID=422564 RepID=A0A811QEN3_9POAL|nr:unnamed protein product [Miscanthus lutarioriparius]
MRSEVITACTIDSAVERILEELKDIGGTSSGRQHNIIYFDGWDGLGASAVLREVGRRLAPAASEEKKPALGSGLEFKLIINLDCSKWESRRALLQRVHCFVRGAKALGILDGTIPEPRQVLEAEVDGKKKEIPNPSMTHGWKKINDYSATGEFGLQGGQSRARITNLRMQLATTKKGSLTTSDYFNKMQNIKDELALAGVVINDDEVVAHLLNGLDYDYHPFVSSMMGRSGDLSLSELYSLLMEYDLWLEMYQGTDQFQSSANMASRGRGSRSRSGGRRGGRSNSGRNGQNSNQNFTSNTQGNSSQGTKKEDDYNGVDKEGSRAEIPLVADAIYRHIQKHLSSRFLVIFNNGSCNEIDLESFGFPLSGYSRNKALWSFQGGFRLYPRTAVNNALESMKMTDVFLSAASDPDPAVSGFNLSSILHHEAAEIARKINIGGINWPAAATDCFLYMVKLCRMGSHLMDYDLATHSCNYWKCDDVIQLQHGTDDDDDDDGRVWLSYDALQHEMILDVDYYQSPSFPSPVSRLPEQISYWTSPTCGFMLIPDQNGRIPKGMFQQYDTLRVLKLSACMFSCTSPPFLCCHSLRFLWLDHCREESSSTDGDGVAGNEDIPSVLPRAVGAGRALLKLKGRLQNIRKLRVTKSHATASYYTDMGGLFSGKDKMELLDFSANSGHMTSFPAVSSCNSLETVIINGSTSLKEVSLKGCATLKNLLLSGLFQQLYSLDITGTAVKTLDLSAVEAPMLDQLFLLGCGKLYAILWPPEGKRKRYMGKLRMDTTQKEGSNTTATKTAAMSGGGSPVEFDWYISVREARILGSLVPVKDYFGPNDAHVVISTTPSHTHRLRADAAGGNKGNRMKGKDHNSIYADVATTLKEDTIMDLQADGGDCEAWATILSITSIFAAPLGSSWNKLEWCRVERCPELECVFSPQVGAVPDGSSSHMDIFKKLKIIWASHLRNTRCVLERPSLEGPRYRAFADLTLLHLYRCPRLLYAVPLQLETMSLENLETLEIMWCGDLSVVFHLFEETSDRGMYQCSWNFPNLKVIHLHELPRLRGIFNVPWYGVNAPKFETVRIRGCWSLWTLPPFCRMVKCDCEKEWWDRMKESRRKVLTHYHKPTHSRYYKKTMLRGSLLR